MRNAKILGVLTLCMGVSVGLLGSQWAQGGGKDKSTPKSERTDWSKSAQAVEDVGLAFRLVEFGRKYDSPEALLSAAHILSTIPVMPGEIKASPEKAKEFNLHKYAQDLIEDAWKMEGGADLKKIGVALKAKLKEPARTVAGGVFTREGQLVGGDRVDTFNVRFLKGWANVVVTNIQDRADLDLFVYNDDTGALVKKDDRTDDDARVSFYVNSPGQYRIEIRNFTPGKLATYVLTAN